jgi:hypothetical protein
MFMNYVCVIHESTFLMCHVTTYKLMVPAICYVSLKSPQIHHIDKFSYLFHHHQNNCLGLIC